MPAVCARLMMMNASGAVLVNTYNMNAGDRWILTDDTWEPEEAREDEIDDKLRAEHTGLHEDSERRDEEGEDVQQHMVLKQTTYQHGWVYREMGMSIHHTATCDSSTVSVGLTNIHCDGRRLRLRLRGIVLLAVGIVLPIGHLWLLLSRHGADDRVSELNKHCQAWQ